MRICILGSGSSGNSTLIVSGDTRVLVDCGLSGKETMRRIMEVGEDPHKLNGIVITHEHGDHASGMHVVAKTTGAPVFVSDATFDACNLGEKGKKVKRGDHISSAKDFDIGEIKFHPFTIPHDAADPFAFTVESAGIKIGMAVDLGYYHGLAAERFLGCDALILESNYESDMLRACTFYPWSLKQRIMGRHGHVSNDELARFLKEDFDGKAQHLVLAHLSQNSNHPEVARMAAVQALEERSPLFSADAQKKVKVANYATPTEWIEL